MNKPSTVVTVPVAIVQAIPKGNPQERDYAHDNGNH